MKVHSAIILAVTVLASSLANATYVCSGTDFWSNAIVFEFESLTSATASLTYAGYQAQEVGCAINKAKSQNLCQIWSGDGNVTGEINIRTGKGTFSVSNNTDADGANPVTEGDLTCVSK